MTGTMHQQYSSKIANTALMPRIIQSLQDLDLVIKETNARIIELRPFNQTFAENISYSNNEFQSFAIEKKLFFAMESLIQIENRLRSLTNIKSIPNILPPTIQVIRIISCQLFDILPKSSHVLAEISSNLGGILMDSGIITEARLDFKQHNIDSKIFLDEAKLIVDSKFSKLYPNLDSI